MNSKNIELENRLIDFAVSVINISEIIPSSFAGDHLSRQLIRSGSNPALQYGEVLGSESKNDFIHKMKIALKELRESYNTLRVMQRKNWVPSHMIVPVLDENNQLISIFVKSLQTAQKNHLVK